jgi:hypothetical protein
MPRKKLTPQQAKAMLMADGMSFQEDFHALGSSAVQALADVTKLAGYRKSKNAPGSTARMFYQYLSRVEPVVRAPGELSPAERRAYQARARQSHATVKKSPAQLDREIAEVLTAPAASSSIKLPPGAPAAWAHKHFSTAHTPNELAEIWRVMKSPWSGMGRYYASRTGVAQSEINSVHRQHQARLGAHHSTVTSDAPTKHLKCDMTSTCTSPVTHVDEKGYVYCTPHGIGRRAYNRCRKLTPSEKKKLERGETISY